jgi:ribosomal protein S12 methylthiotransferase
VPQYAAVPGKQPVVRIVTLGCAKNQVDSEEIAGVLRDAGLEVDAAAARPDVTIVNTCGFLQASKEEAAEVIRKAVRSKGRGKVIVAGCLPQRIGGDIARVAPGADLYAGVGQMARFPELVQRALDADGPVHEIEPPHHRWAAVTSRARAGSPWSAYLKVSEGCDHRCSFCAIPAIRGPHVSKPIERVVEEARHLAATGAVELNLVAQDVTHYGFDIYREAALPRLLRELDAVEGVAWIRLLYLYPSRVTPEVVEAMATLPKVLPYADIPLQHAHPDTLRRMRRPWEGERYLRLIERMRAAIPDLAVRTTFIVGFPGETEREFEHLLDFAREARFDRAGAFVYSREPGTPSHDMPGQVPAKVKRQRLERLMRVQAGVSLERNRAWTGRDMRVLAEEARDGWTACRSFRDAPEVDGLVLVPGALRPGSMTTVRIERTDVHDLYAAPPRNLVRMRPG